jgi:iron complex transport system permease protein
MISASKPLGILLPLGLLAGLAVLSLSWGPYPVWKGMASGADPWAWPILLEFRLPRLLMAVLAGALLSLSGGIFQSILSNPLGDPYILGVSGGAATGAVLATLLGCSRTGLGLPLLAFAGAALTALCVYILASVSGRPDTVRLILAGVVLNALHTALILFGMSLLGSLEMGGFVRWMMGNLRSASLGQAAVLGGGLLILGLPVLLFHRGFDLMALGSEEASALGLQVRAFRACAYAAASALAALTVAFVGIIGFVGLVAPNLVRLVWGGSHRTLLPLAVLWGAVFLTAADLVTRLPRMQEMPVGAVAALFGVPFFLYLLRSWR